MEGTVWCEGGKVGVLWDGARLLARRMCEAPSQSVEGGWAWGGEGRGKVGGGVVSKAAGPTKFGLSTSL